VNTPFIISKWYHSGSVTIRSTVNIGRTLHVVILATGTMVQEEPSTWILWEQERDTLKHINRKYFFQSVCLLGLLILPLKSISYHQLHVLNPKVLSINDCAGSVQNVCLQHLHFVWYSCLKWLLRQCKSCLGFLVEGHFVTDK